MVATTFSEEAALGFAFLVCRKGIDDERVRADLKTLARKLGIERLFDDLLRLVRPTSKKSLATSEVDDAIIRLTASWV
jgi:hypothetical protein